jgi:ADP-ribose pyrophosphatase YjhB (NUDIX family)
MLAEEIRFCIQCGTGLENAVRFGKTRPCCPNCQWTYFADPKVAAAVLVEQDGKVLLVRRVNEPYRGQWTLPAGFVDAGEDPAQAAARECFEETGLRVQVAELADVIAGQEHPRGAHIVIAYRARVIGGELCPGDDADHAAFFSLQNLPPLAFAATQKVLATLKQHTLPE